MKFKSHLLVCALLVTMCAPSIEESPSCEILYNQVGYPSNAPKRILLQHNATKVMLVPKHNHKTELETNVKHLGKWPYSDSNYVEINFSHINKEGDYLLKIDGQLYQQPVIKIKNEIYKNLATDALKAFYYARASQDILETHAGKWSRKKGHPDTAVYVHSSAATKDRPEKSIISSPGGWYDAGDYNKYILSAGITVHTILSFYQMFPNYASNVVTNIPESKNNIPDILDESLYKIRWMLTMQDMDGGVYHKLTTLKFSGFEMPDKLRADRYVVQKTTPATLNFVSIMSQSHVIFNQIDGMQSFADSCLDAAHKAWNWASKNPGIFYQQPKDVHTGAYPDTCLTDEFFWASAEYAIASKDASILKTELLESENFVTPSWDVTNTLGLLAIVNSKNILSKEIVLSAKQKLLSVADELYDIFSGSACKVSLNYFKWGSNSDVVNQGMLAIYAYQLTQNNKYLEMAYANAEYVLGRNATGYCYMTGWGQKTPVNIHHRPSGADSVDEPIPGFLVGGPNYVVPNDVKLDPPRTSLPALSYVDHIGSYSTNEVAINWNAPAFFLFAALDE
ncbi:MAG: glycoside hydrolase family 9 protein [Bacteroidales bacterium]|nr:glycoside hydrolase family 9 protein [Bacteroidales bacterium]